MSFVHLPVKTRNFYASELAIPRIGTTLIVQFYVTRSVTPIPLIHMLKVKKIRLHLCRRISGFYKLLAELSLVLNFQLVVEGVDNWFAGSHFQVDNVFVGNVFDVLGQGTQGVTMRCDDNVLAS